MLQLRALEPSDADWVFRACQDPEIQRWTRVPSPYLLAHAASFVVDGVGSYAQWAVVEAGGDGLGTAALHSLFDGAAELGYWTAPWARRRGVASWVVAELCRQAVAAGAERAWADVAQGNTASGQVLRAAGFVVDPGATAVATDGARTAPADRWVRDLADLADLPRSLPNS